MFQIRIKQAIFDVGLRSTSNENSKQNRPTVAPGVGSESKAVPKLLKIFS